MHHLIKKFVDEIEKSSHEFIECRDKEGTLVVNMKHLCLLKEMAEFTRYLKILDKWKHEYEKRMEKERRTPEEVEHWKELKRMKKMEMMNRNEHHSTNMYESPEPTSHEHNPAKYHHSNPSNESRTMRVTGTGVLTKE